MPPTPSGAAFVLFCLTTVVMIVRPGEIVPGLASVPFYEMTILGTLMLAPQSVLHHFKWSSLKLQPVALCLVGTFIAIPVSQLSHFYFGGALSGAILFAKAAMLYVLLVAVVDRWSRFETLLTVIAASATFTIGLCVIDYLGIVDLPFIKHAEEGYGQDLTGDSIRIERMNGTGIFSDPNDISLLIAATGFLCLSFITNRNRSPLRFAWLGPLLLMGVALACTKSRGGVLAAASGCGVLLMFRYGRAVAITLGGLAVVALPVLAGRQGNIDLSEGTGHTRILLWRDGLAALRSKDIVLGTGQGSYQDIAGLVAHNSFIHAYVELGLVGGTFFFGMFFFCAYALFRLNTPQFQIHHPDQARFLPTMAAVGAAWTIGLMSLSRCYTVSTLLILALATAYLNLAGWNLRPRRPVLCWERPHISRLVFSSLAMFIALNLFVRVVA